MAKKAIVLLAEGFEEVEAVTPTDYLRRAGVEVTIAAIGEDLVVKGSREISIKADTTLAELTKQGKANAGSWDAIILPGGGRAASNLAASAESGALLKEMAGAGKLVCAICASPAAVLAPLGLLSGKKFTCHPGLEKMVQNAHWSHNRVVADANIITSRAAGTAGEFAVAIISRLLHEAEGRSIAEKVLLK